MSNIGHPTFDETTHSGAQEQGLDVRWFYLFFFISGFCSLVYEVVWLRLAVAKFGITTPLVSILLSVFMAGLGLGSWGGGVFIRRFTRSAKAVPLRLYALLEFLIGLSSLLVPMLLRLGSDVLGSVTHDLAWDSGRFYLLSGSWVALSLLPWCTCMGATFPFAMAALQRFRRDGSERSFSYLYLANVLGAVMGTLVPAFVLIELLGFQGTLHVAGALNLTLAISVFLLSFRPTFSSVAGRPQVNSPEAAHEGANRRLLWLLFTTGLCSMAMEVIWIRQFTVYLGNVVYAFATILALYLCATFAGSALYRRWAGSGKSDRSTFLWIVAGLCSLLPLVFSDPRLPIPEVLGTLKSLSLGAIRTALGIVPFSATVGFLTPMLVDRWSGGEPDRAGRAYAINVLGSILGPLVSGFWIIPWMGERWGLCLIAMPLFAAGFASVRRAGRGEEWLGSKARPLFGTAIAASLLVLILTRDYSVKYPGSTELRDHTATVIASGSGMAKRLLVNGTGMTKLTPITKMMAHLPLAYLKQPAKKGLVICMGMGTTFRSMLSWGIDSTVVELVPSVPKLFSFFHPDSREFMKSGKAHIVVDDGRRFLERSAEQYDVMAIDPPPPIGAPTSSLLYSLEFYAIVKPHLRPQGILQVWCPGGDAATNSSITKAIQVSFPYVRAFDSLEGWGTHYLVSMQPIIGDDAGELVRRMPPAAQRDLTEFNPKMTAGEMMEDVLDGEDELKDLTQPAPAVPPITDDRAINEYFLLRSIGW